MTKRHLALPLLLMLALALTAGAQSNMPTDLEIGFRWTDITGNQDMYRTQVNEDEGLLIRSFRLSTVDFGGSSSFLDHFRLDVSDLGAGPAGALRLEAGKTNQWKLNLNYRQADAFNSVPTFALGQHTIDRTRRMLDVDLDFMEGRSITPFIGISASTYKGPGTTTYTLGQDEFLLNSDLDETEKEIRGGVNFNVGKFAGMVEQGWRDVSSDETMTLASGAGDGNNPGTILGVPINADTLTRTSNFDVSTPFTNAYVTGQLTSRLSVIGNYSRFAADGDGPESESASGSFVSFPISRYFGLFDEHVSSRSKNTTWRGGLRGEFAVNDRVDVFAAWRTEHRSLDGTAAFDTIFGDTVNFSGADPIAALEQVFDADSALDRDEDTIEVGASARLLGPFSVRGSYRRTDQDVKLSPDLEEIVVAGPAQMGSYSRSIDTISASGAYSKSGLTLVLTLGRDRADDPVMRTDYVDRDRVRFRGTYGVFSNRLRLGTTIEKIDENNDLGYDGNVRNYSSDFEFAPVETLSVRGSYSKYKADSKALIRRPETLELDQSIYTEDGDAIEAGFTMTLAPVSVDTSFSRFKNEGSNPFDLDRFRVRAVWDFLARTGIALEWARDEYTDELLKFTNYKGSRYGVFLRYRQ